MRLEGDTPRADGEQELRARLRSELAGFQPPPAPVDGVLANAVSLRSRRRLTALAGLAAFAVIGVVLAVTSPASVPVPSAVHTGTAPDPRAPGGVFATGTVYGRAWRLAVSDIADVGPACLPAVLLNGRDGDLLPRSRPGPSPVIGYAAFLAQDPAQPAAGFGFVQVSPGVSRVVAQPRRGAALVLRPVTVNRCGQRFRLAGFAFSPPGVRRITAYLPGGSHASLAPPGAVFSQGVLPPGLYSTGLWSNVGTGNGVAASGRIGSGRIGKLSWTVSVTLGGEGECYLGTYRGQATAPAGHSLTGGSPRTTSSGDGTGRGARDTDSGPRAAGAASAPLLAGTDADQRAGDGAGGASRSSVECQPPQAPSRGAGLSWLPVDALMNPQMTGFAGTVGARTSYLVATGADGTVRRVTPTVVGGRKYFALVIPPSARVDRLTLYGARGQVLASTTLFPATG